MGCPPLVWLSADQFCPVGPGEARYLCVSVCVGVSLLSSLRVTPCLGHVVAPVYLLWVVPQCVPVLRPPGLSVRGLLLRLLPASLPLLSWLSKTVCHPPSVAIQNGYAPLSRCSKWVSTPLPLSKMGKRWLSLLLSLGFVSCPVRSCPSTCTFGTQPPSQGPLIGHPWRCRVHRWPVQCLPGPARSCRAIAVTRRRLRRSLVTPLLGLSSHTSVVLPVSSHHRLRGRLSLILVGRHLHQLQQVYPTLVNDEWV